MSTYPWLLLDDNDGRYHSSSFVFGTGLEPAYPENERLQNEEWVRGWMVWDIPTAAAVAIGYWLDGEPGGTWNL